MLGDVDINLIYSCSGAANTGHLADQVMRKLAIDRLGSSTCLAGIGANLSGFLSSAKAATKNIILDGCKVGCGAKQFEYHNLPSIHFVMTDSSVKNV